MVRATRSGGRPTTGRRGLRRGLTALLATAALALSALVGAPSAAADAPFGHPMPAGHWSFVRGDAYLHYACKVPQSGAYGPVYLVKTLTWYNGQAGAVNQGIGVYTATTRGSNTAIVDQRSSASWYLGFVQTQLWASAWYADRLWVQGAYYGPSAPWTAGVPVRNLVTC